MSNTNTNTNTTNRYPWAGYTPIMFAIALLREVLRDSASVVRRTPDGALRIPGPVREVLRTVARDCAEASAQADGRDCWEWDGSVRKILIASATGAVAPSVEPCRDRLGRFPSFSSMGGYPLLYGTARGLLICGDCVNVADQDLDHELVADGGDSIESCSPLYEGPDYDCDCCGEPVESAYGDPDEPDLSARVVDVCLPDYLAIGPGERREILCASLGDSVRGTVADLIESLPLDTDCPAEESEIERVLTATLAGVDLRWIDGEGNRQESPPADRFEEEPLLYVALEWD